MSLSGPSRHLARAHQSGRFQIKADINGRQEALTNGKVAGGTKNPVLRTSGNSADSWPGHLLARPAGFAFFRYSCTRRPLTIRAFGRALQIGIAGISNHAL
jgi:hypothetical protein